MNNGGFPGSTGRAISLSFATTSIALVLLSLATKGHAQPPVSAQSGTSGKLQFDVASVRQNTSGDKPGSNIPLGAGDVYGPSGGVLSAKNLTLIDYLVFAFKMTDYQTDALRAKAPYWMTQDRFNIEARTDIRNLTKDQMRLMMQSLLADRFKLAIHYESRQVPVFALLLVEPGTTGPKLRPHPGDIACLDFSPNSKTADGSPVSTLPDASTDGFPTFCGGILGVPASAQDRYSFGARNVPMSTIASSLSRWGHLGRPVIDRTGLSGAYDFVLDFTPEPRPTYATIDSGGPTFREALKRQLALKLEPQKADVPFLVLDHVEHPTAN